MSKVIRMLIVIVFIAVMSIACHISETPQEVQVQKIQEVSRTIKLSVFNGSGEEGVAKQVAEYLESQGYDILEVGNAAHFDYERTEIRLYSDESCVSEAAADVKDILKSRTTIHEFETILYLTMGELIDSDIIIVLGKDCVLSQ